LPHLAECSDGDLRSLAEKELRGVAEPQDQVTLGNGWWDLANKEDDEATEAQLRRRASYWYQQALPMLPDGLAKEEVKKKLERMPSSLTESPTSPQPPGVVADKLVVWNLPRSRQGNNNGTVLCTVTLRHEGQTVWERSRVPLAWSPSRDERTELPLPQIPFDALRITVLRHAGYRGGLREIGVYSQGKNIAALRDVTTNDEEASTVPAMKAVNGKLDDGQGWYLAPNKLGWIEIDFSKPPRR